MELLPKEDLGSVRLWRVGLDVGPEDEARLRETLAADELGRAESLSGPVAQRRYAVARGTLRTLLGSLLEVDPRSVPIAVGPAGKPRLAGVWHGLHFNLSHSGDHALIAVADREVGVDLEALRPVRSALAIARRRFTPEEARFVEEGEVGERDRRFLLCWTRKEALVKAAGTGLGGDARTQDWELFDLPVGDEHVGAMALRRDGPSARSVLAPRAGRAMSRSSIRRLRA